MNLGFFLPQEMKDYFAKILVFKITNPMKNKTNIFVLLFSIATTSLMAQELLPLSLRQKEELKKQSWVRETPFEPVKVKDMGNRISALAVNPANASHFVVAPHQGGVWLIRFY